MPKRWYESPETNQKETVGINSAGGFDAILPAEWESWLRHRRYDIGNVKNDQILSTGT